MQLIAMLLFLTFPMTVHAVCPVCTVAVGAGLGLSRYIGLDDGITGLWIGAFLVSSSFWFASYLRRKGVKIRFLSLLLSCAFLVLTILPLWKMGIIGHPENKLWGIDKLLLGTVAGSWVFVFSVILDRFLRLRNGGRVLFYYQKAILPLILLCVVSVVYWLAVL